MTKIQQLTLEFGEYLKDESRSCGHADTISFPRTTDDVRQVLAELARLDEEGGTCTPVCVQGGRTGLAAGAVPASGHVMNLSKMNAYLGMRACDDGRGATRLFVRVQPGLVLSQLRSDLADKNIPCAGFDDASMAAWHAFQEGPEVFFPTDPTEVSATIGGMVACNASGARSLRYGAVRPHVIALRVVLADGQTLALTRGQAKEHDGVLSLTTEQGGHIEVPVPTYTMPSVKNASGYYAVPGMDAVDLFVGSDGTLGVICEIELELLAAPAVTWGVSCFFEQEQQAMDFTCAARGRITCASAMEFFDEAALAILAHQRTTSRAFATLPVTPEGARCCIFVELVCQSEDKAYEELWEIADLMGQVGADESRTWVARTDLDREAQRFFRHAVPESVNMLIDERRKTDPTITKLGSDMSVPDACLHEVVQMYRTTLAEAGLESAVWGHIGNNHLHVNVLPRDAADYARGKELFKSWAGEVTHMGGAVSAEHGVGKIKRDFLEIMYGTQAIHEMARAKVALDPRGILGQGNLFGPDVLDAEVAAHAAAAHDGQDCAPERQG